MQIDPIRDLRNANDITMAEVYRKLLEAENELADGKMTDGKAALSSLRAKYE